MFCANCKICRYDKTETKTQVYPLNSCDLCGCGIADHVFNTIKEMQAFLDKIHSFDYKSDIRIHRFYDNVIEEFRCKNCNPALVHFSNIHSLINHIQNTGHAADIRTSSWFHIELSSNINMIELNRYLMEYDIRNSDGIRVIANKLA